MTPSLTTKQRRVNLWENIAGSFHESTAQPVVVLITTANPKNIGGIQTYPNSFHILYCHFKTIYFACFPNFVGAVTLNSTSATRLYCDADIAETQQFMTR